MNKVAQIKAKPVHFGGAGESKAAFLGGHIDALAQTYGEVFTMLKDGKVKVIAVATDERMKELPDVPTFKEVGINLVISSNRGFAAPKATPPEVVDKLAEAFKKASADPEYLEQMAKMGPAGQVPRSGRFRQAHQGRVRDLFGALEGFGALQIARARDGLPD